MSIMHSPARTQCDCCNELATIFRAWNEGKTLEEIGKVVNEIALAYAPDARTEGQTSESTRAADERIDRWENE